MNMLATIVPKSDQLNADDLIGGPRTITITDVSLSGSAEQPVSMSFEGDGKKPYKPCKSMRRVLVQVWGADAKAYVGRAMTLYRDPGVQYGGLAVGGIRISHMSHIDKDVTMALTATRANRKPFTVQPLRLERPAQRPDAADPSGEQRGRSKADERADQIVALFEACADAQGVMQAIDKARASMDALRGLGDQGPFQRADAARAAAYQKHMQPPEEGDDAEAAAIQAEG